MHCLIFYSLLWSSFVPQTMPLTGDLFIKVDNIEAVKGTLFVAIYQGEENFLDESKAILISAKVEKGGSQEIKVPAFPFGEYAFAIFHDLNNNRKLDTNLVGIPNEPFAFSGIPESRFRKPFYAEVKFQFIKDGQRRISRLSTFW